LQISFWTRCFTRYYVRRTCVCVCFFSDQCIINACVNMWSGRATIRKRANDVSRTRNGRRGRGRVCHASRCWFFYDRFYNDDKSKTRKPVHDVSARKKRIPTTGNADAVVTVTTRYLMVIERQRWNWRVLTRSVRYSFRKRRCGGRRVRV